MCGLLGPNGETAIFIKMVIKGESGLNMQPLHQDKTGTIGKTEFVIGKLFKKKPGLFSDLRGDVFDTNEPARPQGLSELNGDVEPGPKTHQGITFIQDIIRGDEHPAILETGITETQGFLVMSVPSVLYGQKGRGI